MMGIDSQPRSGCSRAVARRLCAWAVLVLIVASVPGRSEEPLRVTNKEGRQAALVKPEPDYPAMAKQLRVSGRAVVDVYVDVDGKVEKVEIVSGNPLFTAVASGVAKKWKFKPFKTADHRATAAVVQLEFEFNL